MPSKKETPWARAKRLGQDTYLNVKKPLTCGHLERFVRGNHCVACALLREKEIQQYKKSQEIWKQENKRTHKNREVPMDKRPPPQLTDHGKFLQTMAGVWYEDIGD